MKMNKGVLLIFSLVILMTLGACDESTGTSSGEVFTIGASQFVEHPSLDAAYEGFQAALDDSDLNVEFELRNAQGDQSNVNTIRSEERRVGKECRSWMRWEYNK